MKHFQILVHVHKKILGHKLCEEAMADLISIQYSTQSYALIYKFEIPETADSKNSEFKTSIFKYWKRISHDLYCVLITKFLHTNISLCLASQMFLPVISIFCKAITREQNHVQNFSMQICSASGHLFILLHFEQAKEFLPVKERFGKLIKRCILELVAHGPRWTWERSAGRKGHPSNW